MDFGYNNASIFGQHSFLSEKCGGNAYRIRRPFSRSAQEELHRKQQELNLFYVFKVTTDTIPLTVRITTSDGIKVYTVDAKKSEKNISQNMAERSWHSIVCMKTCLSVDTLRQLWDEELKGGKFLSI